MAPMQKEMKTAQVNLRIHPSLKAAAEKAADQGHRSLTSLIENVSAEYCKRKGFLKSSWKRSSSFQNDDGCDVRMTSTKLIKGISPKD
jgi:hypothetical protein